MCSAFAVVDEPDEVAWDRAVALHEAAVAAMRERREAEALELAERALVAFTEAVGAGHPDTANAHDTVAEVLTRIGEPVRALEHLARAHAIVERFRDEPAVTEVRLAIATHFAFWLGNAGRYGEAEAIARATIDEAEGLGSDPIVYRAANSLGVLMRFQGRLDEAEAAYARARAAIERLGEPLPLTLLHNLAGLACARERYGEAEAILRASIATRRATEEDNIGLAMDLCGLGDALAGLGRVREAELSYREALALYARLVPDNPEVAYTLHNLADLLAANGRGDEAEAAYREAITRKASALGEDHHEVAGSLANLAALLAEGGRVEEARTQIRRALAIVRRSLAPDHHVRAACESLAASLGVDG